MSSTGDPDLAEKTKLVENVVQGKLKQVVEKFLEKGIATRTRDAQDERKQIRRLLTHTEHCWKVLLQKQASLQVGLHIFQKEIWPDLWKRIEKARTAHPDYARKLLEHLFLCLLRFRDGLILLTSGECRHDGDFAAAESYGSRCKSQLNKNTETFRADLTYSGASWDEWNDGKNGISARWRDLFKNPKAFDKMMGRVSAFEELIITPLETAMRQVKNDEQRFVDNHIVPKLKANFHGVKLSLTDKTEYLRLTFPDNHGTFGRERKGKKFQLPDKQGILPIDGDSLHELWRKVIAVPSKDNAAKPQNGSSSNVQKKRRIVINDDDDDDDEAGDTACNKTLQKSKKRKQESSRTNENYGLDVLETQKPAIVEAPKQTETSLNKIKEGMGVDAQTLSSGREAIEHEEATALPEGNYEPTEIDRQEHADMRVKQMRRELRAIQRKQEVVDPVDRHSNARTEVMMNTFNAKEALREVLVAAGNVYLNSSEYHHFFGPGPNPNHRRVREVQKALECFDEALAIVQEQTAFMRSQRILTPSESRFSFRNLFLLHGRASINRGIAFFKLWQQKGKRSLLKEAIDDLEEAVSMVQLLLVRVKCEYDKDGLDVLDHQVQGFVMQAMAARWMGVALWHQKHYSKSRAKFEEGVSVSNQFVDEALFRFDMIELRLECYHGCSTAYELARTKLEKYPVALLQEEKEKRKASVFFGIATDMLANAKNASVAIESLLSRELIPDDVNSAMQEKGVLSSEDLDSTMDDLKRWWEGRENAANQTIETQKGTYSTSGPTVPLANDPCPRRVFTVTANSQLQNRRKHQSQGHATTNVRLRTYSKDDDGKGDEDLVRSTQAASSTRYQKWGDELLPQMKDPTTGEIRPVLKYPCVAPVMPPEIAARIAALATQ